MMGGVRAAVLATVAMALAPGAAGAQTGPRPPTVLPFDMPWTDRAPEVRQTGAGRWLSAAALGRPDPRVDRLSVRRRSARREGEKRAREALHRWVDDAMARVRARPPQAAAVHRAVARRSVVLGVRPLVEGAAVVMVGLPLQALRSAAELKGVPWAS